MRDARFELRYDALSEQCDTHANFAVMNFHRHWSVSGNLHCLSPLAIATVTRRA